MNTQHTLSSGADSESRWIFRVGAVSALLVLIGYIATFPVYAWVGNPPTTGIEAQLVYFADKAAGWWIIAGLMVSTDLLLIPLFLALYHALKDVRRYMMLIALAFMYLFVVLDLAITWMAFSELIINGTRYVVATDAAKTLLIAGASHASAMLESPLGAVYAIVFPATGVALASLVMLRGGFGKVTAYLGVLMGITGFAYLGAYVINELDVLRYINALLATAWYGFVGVKLLRLYRQ